MTLPCIGAGILVVDPGPKADDVFKKRMDGRPSRPKPRRLVDWRDRPLRLLKAYVIDVDTMHAKGAGDHLGGQIIWKCGIREGSVYENAEGTTWAHGHGPQARAALMMMRATRAR